MTGPRHITYAAGHPRDLAAMVTNYRCGHCTGEVVELVTNNATGAMHAHVEHDDGCPVLNGTLPAGPDIMRAARVPDTFRR